MGRSIIPREEKQRKQEPTELQKMVGAVYAYCGMTQTRMADIAQTVGMKRSTFYLRMKQPETMTLGEWIKIRKAIGTDLRL